MKSCSKEQSKLVGINPLYIVGLANADKSLLILGAYTRRMEIGDNYYRPRLPRICIKSKL